MEQQKNINQLAPEMAPSAIYDAYAEIELTDEEAKLALLDARQKKYARIKQQEYMIKLQEAPRPKKYKAEELFEKLGSEFTIDDFNRDIAWKMCLYFTGDLRNELNLKKGLLLYGNIGCGKTSLMRFFRNNQTNSFAVVSVRDVSDQYQKGGADSILRYKALIPSSDVYQTYGDSSIGVCFDDLGTEVDKKHFGNESNVMADILLTRYDRFKILAGKTHITTNLNTAELTERYGDRVRSRLREMFNVLIFDDNAPDRRK